MRARGGGWINAIRCAPLPPFVHGLISTFTGNIKLNCIPDFDDERFDETIFHELVHGAFARMGLDMDHDLIRLVARGLVAEFRYRGIR